MFYHVYMFTGEQGSIKLPDFSMDFGDGLSSKRERGPCLLGLYVLNRRNISFFLVKMFTNWLCLKPGPNSFMTQIFIKYEGLAVREMHIHPRLICKRKCTYGPYRLFNIYFYWEQFACCWQTRMLPTAGCQGAINQFSLCLSFTNTCIH